MATMYDSETGFELGDPDRVPLSDSLPSRDQIDKAFGPLILSASGWRKVFAQSGDEESFSPEIGDANRVLVALMADAFASFLERRGDAVRTIVLGVDTRPTGAQIADVMCRAFLARSFSVQYLFISAAPEIMAHARSAGAFAYISASHNPVGHNGVKFGLSDGGVLDGASAATLIADYRRACASPDAAEKAVRLMRQCRPAELASIWARVAELKSKALANYGTFTKEVISGTDDPALQESFIESFKSSIKNEGLRGNPVSIVADFNGSARTRSIDRTFMESLGIRLYAINDRPGGIAHRIVPEGESLSWCAREIERLRREGSDTAERNAVLGYVPDCDGDRGNIVFWDEGTGSSGILGAQEVFALCVISELAFLAHTGQIRCVPGKDAEPPAAIAVNDPTSLLIDEIAGAFGVRVARAEVGEANVVNLARGLRSQGSIVRILGEGSNGGNITHPSAVRDPIDTVFALLKLLVMRDTDKGPGLFHIWCSLSGNEASYRDSFTFADIRATLPPFVTTSVFEKEAQLSIHTADHGELKGRFGEVFHREWELRKESLLRDFGIADWKAWSYNGTASHECSADFASSGKGGLKVLFYDTAQKPVAFIWMRGSGTEPVFRILADAKGKDPATEEFLRTWLGRMVLEADSKIR